MLEEMKLVRNQREELNPSKRSEKTVKALTQIRKIAIARANIESSSATLGREFTPKRWLREAFAAESLSQTDQLAAHEFHQRLDRGDCEIESAAGR